MNIPLLVKEKNMQLGKNISVQNVVDIEIDTPEVTVLDDATVVAKEDAKIEVAAR